MIFANKMLLTLCIFFIQNHSLSQSALEDQHDYAFKLYCDEKYFDAITEFKRLQFFDSLKRYSAETNKLIAQCYKQGGKFNEAINYFSLAELDCSNIDSLFNIKIEIIKINLLRKTNYRAFDLLNILDADSRFSDKKKQIIYWKGWAYIFSDEWQKASEEFCKIDVNHELKLLCDNVYESKYAVTKAKFLSYVIPGAGQFYTGNYLSGILSMGWVALWTSISINALIAERIFDGIIVAEFLAFRFYNGNLQNAEKFASEHNSGMSNWMLNYLKKNYAGPKP